MKQIIKAFSVVTFILLLAFPQNATFAQSDAGDDLTREEIRILTTERKLVADKANTIIETAVLDSIRMLFELEEEDEKMSPSDELYDGIWDNEFIKAYNGVVVPDTYRIDLSSFIMPFDGKVTSSFGPRRRRFHYGTDVKLQIGDTVLAAFEGKVRVVKYEKKGYGNYLVLRHHNGLETVYGHLSKFLVNEEETVEAGQPIALGGNTGRSTGSHLHLECRFLGQAIDPADLFDFSNACTYDEAYIFQKSKVNKISKNNSKYIQNKNYSATNTNQGVKYHRIRSGDTLSKIAQLHRVSVNQICRLNGIKPTTILKVGKVIRCS